jgi:hypothetical protein
VVQQHRLGLLLAGELHVHGRGCQLLGPAIAPSHHHPFAGAGTRGPAFERSAGLGWPGGSPAPLPPAG